ncbi:hypothetical protein WN943_021955 [Citrus x changshan-huyou]
MFILETQKNLSWAFMINPFLASAVESDGFRKFTHPSSSSFFFFCLSWDKPFCSFLLGFVCPLMWYYATILYFGNYYHKDPRERSGLAASAIAALICTVVVIIVVAVILL